MQNRKRLLTVLVAVVLLSVSIQWGGGMDAMAQSSYRLRTSTLGAAGANSAGNGKVISGTAGQPVTAGFSAGTGTGLYSGFWNSEWWSLITDSELPDAVRNELFQNYPNPFNPTTTIKYSMASEGIVNLTVYNVKGQLVKTLVDGTQPAGSYSAVWDGRNNGGRSVATGVYFYRLRAGSFSEIKKMILLR